MRYSPVPIGERFGSLVVLRKAASKVYRFVVCRCDCGRETTVRLVYLQKGHTASCGCQRLRGFEDSRGQNRTHGMTHAAEFHAWQSMKYRCHTPTANCYANYGGRGIRVCDRWRDSFAAFFGDMGQRPSSKHSLDRIDNDGHYEPSNVRWATRRQQNWNQRRTDFVTHNGETLPLNEWAKRQGIRQSTLRRRIVELGWSVNAALTTPTNLYHHR